MRKEKKKGGKEKIHWNLTTHLPPTYAEPSESPQ